MRGPILSSWCRRLGVTVAVLAAVGCGGGNAGGTGGQGGGQTGGTAGGTGGSGGGGANTFTATFSGNAPNIDILFMVDNSSSMMEMQQKIHDQIPTFVQTLQALPTPPGLHVGVVSSDMGAPGDLTTSIGCTATGDQGQLQSLPRGTCTSTSLYTTATFISDADMMPNYSDANLADVLQCILPLGDYGCGFEQQLGSIDRALGADGSPVPSSNAKFLRPDAYLAIVMLTNEDDCSAPTNTTVYSAAAGPVSSYRCNAYGHLCTDPATGSRIEPPFDPPADAQGTAAAPTLDLTNCVSNDDYGLLTPVSKFVSDIRALKTDPDNQILVAAIAAPPTPYGVAWVDQGTEAEVMHSCGTAGTDDVNPAATQLTTDYSFGDPAVRISQFVNAFPQNYLGSICDASYAQSMQAIATKIGQLVTPCIPANIQNEAAGNPKCTVTQGSAIIDSCSKTGDQPPCWALTPSTTCSGENLQITDTGTSAGTISITCTFCPAGASGC
jgi:hypothetical protein